MRVSIDRPAKPKCSGCGEGFTDKCLVGVTYGVGPQFLCMHCHWKALVWASQKRDGISLWGCVFPFIMVAVLVLGLNMIASAEFREAARSKVREVLHLK